MSAAQREEQRPRWRDAAVAAEGTHHLLLGQPAYAARFDEVLKFHAPGLAAVRLGADAWHITVTGDAAYARRLRRTFGFYEGLAAVVADDGWLHIKPDGSDQYRARYAFCGNYQEGRCPVRATDGSYLHLDEDGQPAYGDRFRYGGDFRDGAAVVQRKDGASSHIDRDGRFLHPVWFLDLDVFHKGYARARDAAGWMHIDRWGRPLYPRRFAMVEPFYNGQARVETFHGALEVIDEAGRTLVQLRAPRPPGGAP